MSVCLGTLRMQIFLFGIYAGKKNGAVVRAVQYKGASFDEDKGRNCNIQDADCVWLGFRNNRHTCKHGKYLDY